MERRDFLANGLALFGALSAGSTWPKSSGLRRAAIVIGVDKAGDLPRLRGAASGAGSVAQWLAGDGFEVKTFIDDKKPVNAGEIFAAINEIVDRGTYDQLIIYFAGHGFVSGTMSEFWLLSDGPRDPNAAISLSESAGSAELSGIPNVVFISDACRSRADSLSALRVHGSVVFPSLDVSPPTKTDVDEFLATRVGAAAYEAAVADSVAAFDGLYTSCFLDAFKRPYASMVRTVEGQEVVPNRRIGAYLALEVPKRVRARSITLEQKPDAKVCSDERTYIGRVLTPDRLPEGAESATIADVAHLQLWGPSEVMGVSPQYSDEAIQEVAQKTGYEAARRSIARARDLPDQVAARTGFAVTGQHLKSVVSTSRIETKLSNSSQGGESGLVRVDLHGAHGGSVALMFDDGSGTVLAALDGYIGNVVVADGLVSNVSYVPSRMNPMWLRYKEERQRLDSLHSAAAAAAQFGIFRLESPKYARPKEAAALLDRVKSFWGVDPTLGLYAAYACADAGLADSVAALRSGLRTQLKCDLFDLALLVGAFSRSNSDASVAPIPFCPMLSQGWGLLRVRNNRVPQQLAAVRQYLRVSLWATIEADGMEIVVSELRSSRLT